METQEEVTDSPTDWVAKHILSYEETNGQKGHEWNGVTALLLTTRGRKTGTLRRTAVYYGEDEGRYIIVASKGGDDHHPAWYLNLTANSEVQVQIEADKFTARARTATAEEKPRLWELMASKFERYNQYQKATEREIPVVILERV